MRADERLNAARASQREGRHAEALRDYIWFHEHALEENEGFYGVRLSFALAYWAQLGRQYPPALEALRGVRDAKAARLEHGARDFQLFVDVKSINHYLGDEEATYRLFCAIDRSNAAFAAECAEIAMPAVVKAGDLALARRFLPEPEQTIAELADHLNDTVGWAHTYVPDRRELSIQAFVRNYSEKVALLVRILRETGDTARADTLLERAIARVERKEEREAVRSVLAPQEVAVK